MPAPRRKQVSDEVFQRIDVALNVITSDDARPRTKREIENITGLSHDAVARAFRQDAGETNRWGITARFDNLTSELTGARRSADQEKHATAAREVAELKKEISDMHRQMDRYAIAAYTYYLEAHAGDRTQTDPIPIGRNRRATN